MKFSELKLTDFGNSIQISGVIYSGNGQHYALMFPNEDDPESIRGVDIDAQGWKDLVRQTDLMETEIFTKTENGELVKTMMRKSNRQIDQGIIWKVYKRDGYTCRYCNANDVPLTVDHAPIPWERGGPSIEENLVSACRKCNKVKTNKSYSEWLNDPHYLQVSKKLSENQRLKNFDLIHKEHSIPLKKHVTSR